MVTRLQIAQAHAQIALAYFDGASVPEATRKVAAVAFADAQDAVTAASSTDGAPGVQSHAFANAVGVHASGYDFGPHHDSFRLTANDRPPTPAQERVLINAHGREKYEEAARRVACGELDANIQRTRSNGLSAALTVDEAADWIGTETGRVLSDICLGDLFAFVCDDELRLPAWQFTADPDAPTLWHLSRLIPHFEADQHPATILGFMTTPHDGTLVDGVPATPIVWLLADGDPQELIDMLDSFLIT